MIMRNTMDNGLTGDEPDLRPDEPDEPDSGLEEPDVPDSGLEEPDEPHSGLEEPDSEPAVPAPGLRMGLEAVLLVADEPVPTGSLADVTGHPEAAVAAALRDLAGEYTAQQRGFDLREVAGGWRLYTRDECAAVVERFVTDGQEIRLTQAALETLAVVAYRQPVSRARVSAVRGVNCDGVMRTLVLRGLVEEAGSDPETGAILFQTTSYFLERIGLARLSDLPDLTPFLPDQLDEELDFGHDAVR
jgi:segregation and condensation protein B